MRAPHGVQVMIKAGFELVVAVGGTRFHGRFLFLPSSLRAGDSVWLRIEHAESTDRGIDDRTRAVDVTARVTHVFDDKASVFRERTWRPAPGGRFTVTIDRVDPAAPAKETTRARWSIDDDEGDDSIEPTEPTGARASWSATVPDAYAASGTADGL